MRPYLGGFFVLSLAVCLIIPSLIVADSQSDIKQNSIATRPSEELSPRDYAYMQGFLGLSDGDWSFVFLLASLVFSFLIGILCGKTRSCEAVTISIGIVENVVGNLILGGGGGPAFVGFLVIPLICFIAYRIGCAVRWAVQKLKLHHRK
jgi:hypothetical protein